MGKLVNLIQAVGIALGLASFYHFYDQKTDPQYQPSGYEQRFKKEEFKGQEKCDPSKLCRDVPSYDRDSCIKKQQATCINGIDYLITNHIPNSLVNAYHSRFTIADINRFLAQEISAPEANAYDPMFSGEEVVFAINRGVSDSDANEYRSTSFSGEDALALIAKGIPAKAALKYKSRFDAQQILGFNSLGVSALEAKKYNPHFSGNDVSAFLSRRISAAEANKYTPRFSGSTILTFLNEGISAAEANQFEAFYPTYLIIDIHKVKPGEKYGPRFSEAEIREHFISNDILPNLANRFAPYYTPADISVFQKLKILPDQANKYHLRKSDQSLKELKTNWAFHSDSISEIQRIRRNMRYSDFEFSGEDRISEIIRRDYQLFIRSYFSLSDQQANAYAPEFLMEEVIKLSGNNVNNVGPDTANQHILFIKNKKDCAIQTLKFLSRPKSPQYQLKDINDVAVLVCANISPDAANKYPSNLSSAEIVALARERKNPAEISLPLARRYSAEHSPEEAFMIRSMRSRGFGEE